jgi:hypothetical protein
MRIECEGLNNVIARKERLLQGMSPVDGSLSRSSCRGARAGTRGRICVGGTSIHAESARAVD